MPQFSQHSASRLRQCDPLLQALFHEVIETMDCTILEGHRSKARQEQMVAAGRSTVHYPNSKHNSYPSAAVDVAPYPIDWGTDGTQEERRKAQARFYHFAGFVLGVAASQGISIRWGGDWDGDQEFTDQSFDDLVHFELAAP